MAKTRIEWCDYSINPVKGLCPVDCRDNQGKPYCYARRMYKRFGWNPEIRFDQTALFSLPRKPSRIFVGSTMELFGLWVKPQWLDTIFTICTQHQEHTFIFLTKQPQNLVQQSPFPENCWVGVSAPNYRMGNTGRYYLHQIKAAVKFLSFEPLLGQMQDHLGCTLNLLREGISWVVIGQQTPAKASTIPQISWVREIVEVADKASIPVFLKDNLKPLIQSAGLGKASWAAKEWVMCKYPVLRQEYPVSK